MILKVKHVIKLEDNFNIVISKNILRVILKCTQIIVSYHILIMLSDVEKRGLTFYFLNYF